MNIRKFIGANSRDALRQVRETLGPDAVVLSNRTLDDGSVEIVAVADSDIASISPAAQEQAVRSGGASRAALAAAAAAIPVKQQAATNPYVNGDVFSSVFGASADDEDDFASSADDTSRTMADTNPWLIEHAKRLAQQASMPSNRPLTPSAAIARGMGVPVTTLSQAPVQSTARSTESEAGKFALRQQQPARAEAAPQPVSQPVSQPAVQQKVETPDWAREAAQVAARRAAHKINTSAPHAETPAPGAAPATPESVFEGLPANAAAVVTEAIRARMQQVVNDTVMNELSSMREMMEEHFAGLMWSERQRRNPTGGALTKRLFSAGFSAQLVRMVMDNMPEMETVEGALEWVQQVLENNIPVMDSEDALMERGGVFALMGPTGVGKTTTTAKLAARCVMRFGASKVALLTTDSYRIGAHEQLRIFGKILGVSVHAVKDGADLQLALSELRNKHIVLIDTIGMSQRDRMVSDQIAMLCGAGHPVQRILLLNATSHGDTLNEVVQAYKSAPDQPPLAGCILTKLDEATNLGGVLDTVIRYKLPVHYVSTGQKVPENLYVATKRFLIKSAFCIPRDGSPFVPNEEEVPALLSALSARASTDMHGVHFG
ncbi:MULTISPECIES: flagellar biosynthesis protein FlhF [unclassified Caballeronia]|uniref:flagellar biosynthesis protein FlhF n=1 Tax=unclassified Caballeronia TaxID=2646786 RepID=UPI00285F52B3|nr:MULTISPECIES: flagellar biosynthesis protein FlhF [unclassified Caballeronia]MDR5821346.1 flagellar biosynthesis protein FlhF [Caballeronia sp. LZ043]MDR5879523.1 flagellar biosynthesis protein FlhF [Caballeronia sp. LZ032]